MVFWEYLGHEVRSVVIVRNLYVSQISIIAQISSLKEVGVGVLAFAYTPFASLPTCFFFPVRDHRFTYELRIAALVQCQEELEPHSTQAQLQDAWDTTCLTCRVWGDLFGNLVDGKISIWPIWNTFPKILLVIGNMMLIGIIPWLRPLKASIECKQGPVHTVPSDIDRADIHSGMWVLLNSVSLDYTILSIGSEDQVIWKQVSRITKVVYMRLNT